MDTDDVSIAWLIAILTWLRQVTPSRSLSDLHVVRSCWIIDLDYIFIPLLIGVLMQQQAIPRQWLSLFDVFRSRSTQELGRVCFALVTSIIAQLQPTLLRKRKKLSDLDMTESGWTYMRGTSKPFDVFHRPGETTPYGHECVA